jgi:hypothetical protein
MWTRKWEIYLFLVVCLLGHLSLLPDTAIAVDCYGLRVGVGSAGAGMGWRAREDCRALGFRVAGARRLRSGGVVFRHGSGVQMDGWLLVVEAQRRVIADESPVREEWWVAEGEVRDDRDFRGWVRMVSR